MSRLREERQTRSRHAVQGIGSRYPRALARDFARARNVAAETRDQVFASVQTVYSTRYGGDMSGLAPLIEKLQAEYAPKP